MFSFVTLGTNDLKKSKIFYDELLKSINIIRKKLSKKYSHINDKKEIKRLNKRINSFF